MKRKGRERRRIYEIGEVREGGGQKGKKKLLVLYGGKVHAVAIDGGQARKSFSFLQNLKKLNLKYSWLINFFLQNNI